MSYDAAVDSTQLTQDLTDIADAIRAKAGTSDTLAFPNGFVNAIRGMTETDPTVPAWAKSPTKPTYTAQEVGALPSTTLYAGAETAGGPATVTNGLHYAHVDSTSTATVYTATVPDVTEYYDGLTVVLKNGVVTSASGFTVNVNGLGAKPVYSSMAAATRETTIFNVNYTLMLIYDSTRVDGGCWVNYRGYYSDANSIAYQVRGNGGTLPAKDKFVRYRLLFTAADGAHWVPANTSTSTNATASRAVNQSPIDPFGRIVYYSTTAAIAAGANPGAAYLWSQYQVGLGYSFNLTGAALTLTFPAPVYIKCTPKTDGSAIIDSTTPYVQALPSTNDGKIYIFLGIAYSVTNVDLYGEHPVYYHDGSGIRRWTGSAIPTKTSDLTNDSGFITSAPVTSVNGQTGAVTISALPTVTASDNGKVATVVNGAWAAASAGGSSGLLVTVSGSTSTGYTLDKTGREIIDAVNAGFAPVFKYTSSDNYIHIYPFASMSYTAGSVNVRSSGWSYTFTSVGLDNYPSVPPQGGGDN